MYDRYIIPGVGHAGAAMTKLSDAGLVSIVKASRKPVLGICAGMQLLSNFSEEGHSELTKIIPLNTKHFDQTLNLKVPHTCRNEVTLQKEHILFNNIEDGAYFYFVHSYFVEYNSTFTAASTEYGIKFSSLIQKDNFCGVQFHPEKSGAAGEQLLINFAQ